MPLSESVSFCPSWVYVPKKRFMEVLPYTFPESSKAMNACSSPLAVLTPLALIISHLPLSVCVVFWVGEQLVKMMEAVAAMVVISVLIVDGCLS